MTHLISGATGNIGGRVVERLLQLGQRPRIFVRSVDKARARFGDRVEIAVGDLDDPRSLTAAFQGIDAALLVSNGSELARQDACAASAARAAGVKRLVKLSALGARASCAPSAVALWHARGEAAIVESGVPYTFIQPVGFMSNALAWARSIRAEGVVRASTGEGRIAMIHPDDIAAVAVAALSSGDYDGRALVITGPTPLTYREMVSQLAAAIRRPLRFEAIGDEAARSNLLCHGLEPALADALIILWREVREGLVATVTGEVERITGRRPISFAHWSEQNSAAFC